VLVAPDKFKGSLTAVDVARAIRRGITAHAPDAHVTCVPVADGGDGTLDAAVAAGFERVAVTATVPTPELTTEPGALHAAERQLDPSASTPLMKTMPTSSRSAMRWACSGSVVKT